MIHVTAPACLHRVWCWALHYFATILKALSSLQSALKSAHLCYVGCWQFHVQLHLGDQVRTQSAAQHRLLVLKYCNTFWTPCSVTYCDRGLCLDTSPRCAM